ncbi:MAG: amino acid--tRNA ligase-related protein [Kofleriaceae bacterium]
MSEAAPAPSGVRGRVLAVDDEVALVRTDAAELRVPAQPGWRAGDLIDGDRVVRAWPGGDYRRSAAGGEDRRAGARRPARARPGARGAARGVRAARLPSRSTPRWWCRSPASRCTCERCPPAAKWLITSPEFQMKRLLAARLERIVSVCRCHRDEEAGAHHAREFTMVEWYRAWEDLDAIIADTEALVAAVVTAIAGRPVARVSGRDVDVTPPWPRLTVADAMARWAGVEVTGDEPAEELRARVVAAGIDVGSAQAWDDVFYAAFVARVDPALAAEPRPVLLVDWPLPLAALARPRPDDPRVVERVEAYVGGLELANGFGELTDADEQRRRFEADRRARAARGRDPHGLDERLLAALAEGLPPCAGIALGLDRLVMLAAGLGDIREVQAFARDEL